MLTKLSNQFRRTVYTGSIGKVLATYAPVEPMARPSIFSKRGFDERIFRFKNYFKSIFGYWLYDIMACADIHIMQFIVFFSFNEVYQTFPENLFLKMLQ